MNKELANLISLQSIDNEINEIKSLAGDLPKKVSDKEKRIEELESQLSILNEKHKSNEKQIRKLDSENEDSHTKLNKYKDQIYLVKSNREYDALKDQEHFIKDPSLISIIDKIEELVRALRKHIIRK